MREADNLQILNGNITQEDVVYELLKSKKMSLKMWIVDVFCEGIFKIDNALKQSEQLVFLVASEKRGIIYQIQNGKIIDSIRIANWKKEDRDNFKSITIGGYVFKKYRKLDVCNNK